jgi:ABC-type transporter Mla subunit MlaD
VQEFVQDLQRAAGGSDAANAAIQRLIQSSPQLASALLTAQAAVGNAAKRAEELRRATDAAADSAHTGGEWIARASDSFGVLEGKA